jgi:xanthosine utilization system XapX-like protein
MGAQPSPGPARMSTAVPSRKVLSSGAVGAIATIVIWLLQAFAKITIPAEVAAAIVTLLGALTGYFVPPSQNDVLSTP